MSEFNAVFELRSGKDQPAWAKDGLTNRVTVTLSWRDRLRVLLGWKLEVESFTATEGTIGQSQTRSCVRVFHPREIKRFNQLVGEVSEPSAAICTRPHQCGKPGEGPCNGFPKYWSNPGGAKHVP
jgi:hypothetical protein